jgi:hypothetical protein
VGFALERQQARKTDQGEGEGGKDYKVHDDDPLQALHTQALSRSAGPTFFSSSTSAFLYLLLLFVYHTFLRSHKDL